jgi:hypothetical protein
MVDLFVSMCEAYGLPAPTKEYKFHPDRKWRIDYYFENNGIKLAVEVEGGVYSNGRHTRATGFLSDIEKYNELTKNGIYLYRCTPKSLKTQKTIEDIKSILQWKS